MSLSATRPTCNQNVPAGITIPSQPAPVGRGGAGSGKQNRSYTKCTMHTTLTKSVPWSQLSPRARSVFTFLWGRAGGVSERDGWPILNCFAKRQSIADAEGCSIPTVQRALDELRVAGMIETTVRFGRSLTVTLFVPIDSTLRHPQPGPAQITDEPPAGTTMHLLESQRCTTSRITDDTSTYQESLNRTNQHDHNNNTPHAASEQSASTPPPEVVVVVDLLVGAGIDGETAERLARTSNRCKDPHYVEFIITTSKEESVNNPPGFIRARLKHGGEIVPGFGEHARKKQAESELRELTMERDRIRAEQTAKTAETNARKKRFSDRLCELLEDLGRTKPEYHEHLHQAWTNRLANGCVDIESIIEAKLLGDDEDVFSHPPNEPHHSKAFSILYHAATAKRAEDAKYAGMGWRQRAELQRAESELKNRGAVLTT